MSLKICSFFSVYFLSLFKQSKLYSNLQLWFSPHPLDSATESNYFYLYAFHLSFLETFLPICFKQVCLSFANAFF